MLSQSVLEEIVAISRLAGEEILKIYNNPEIASITYKKDSSPLTLADRISHITIKAKLMELFPAIPILSEEGSHIPYAERQNWEYFWLVDPLDGTKEFIKRNGEFTVNIALIHKNKTMMGVIFVPVHQVVYYGMVGGYAYKQVGDHERSLIKVNNKKDGLTVARSRSHGSEEEDFMLRKYNIKDSISVGSSLKFCMVAEGKADIYYRHGPTMEWDTAAGQAIVEAAGGKVLAGEELFLYNKVSLKNGSFFCLGYS